MTIQELKDRKLILLECLSGSRAYGLDTPESDTDIKGVFYLPRDAFFGTNYIAQVSDERNDQTYFELGRFVELLTKNNPNMLELLATPADATLLRNPLMNLLTTEMFLSKRCKESFAGYAMTQVRKARGYNKKVVNPMEGSRKSVEDFCYVISGATSFRLEEWLQERGLNASGCGLSAIPHARDLYALFVPASGIRLHGITSGRDANDVQTCDIPKGHHPVAQLSFNKDAYSIYCKDYKAYQDWLRERNETRYAGNQAHGKNYDAKNMMHTIRLLQVAEEILRDGELNVRRTNREELLSVKRGDHSYADLMAMADELMTRIESAADSSKLPERPDESRIDKALVAMREQLYSKP